MLKKLILFLLICPLLSLKSWTQKMSAEASDFLTGLANNYLNKHDEATNGRKAEFILLFLDTDSNGRIIKTHLMVDEENKGQTFNAIKNIQAVDFKEWKKIEYKNSILILPIYSFGEGNKSTANYVDSLKHSPLFVPKGYSNRNIDYYFVAEPLRYLWPSSRKQF